MNPNNNEPNPEINAEAYNDLINQVIEDFDAEPILAAQARARPRFNWPLFFVVAFLVLVSGDVLVATFFIGLFVVIIRLMESIHAQMQRNEI